MMNEVTSTGSNGATPPKLKAGAQRRSFDDAFKAATVKRIKGGAKLSAVAKELDIVDSVLRRWVENTGTKLAKKKPKSGTAIDSAGRRVFSDKFMRDAVRRLNKGESSDKICEDLNITSSSLYTWRKKIAPETAKRQPKSAKGVPVKRYTEAVQRAAVQRRLDGEDIAVIAEDIGANTGSVYAWVKKYPTGNTLARGKHERQAVTASAAPALAIRDAVTYLKHVKTDMYALLQSGEIKEFEEYHLNTLAALRRLQSLT